MSADGVAGAASALGDFVAFGLNNTTANLIVADAIGTVGGTAVILTNPSAPVGLVTVPAITAATQVGLTWFPGFLDGGS